MLCGVIAAARRRTAVVPDFVPETGDFTTVIGSPTTADGPESLFMSAAIATTQKRALLKSLPGGDFSVTLSVRGNTFVSGCSMGIIFRDSAGAYICVGNVNDGSTPKSTISQLSSASAFSLITGRTLTNSTKPIWFKANYIASSSDVEGFYSYTGDDNWTSMGTSTALATADAFGLGFIQAPVSTETDPQTAWFTYFEVVV